jgi:GT2 family glycosyltransferase
LNVAFVFVNFNNTRFTESALQSLADSDAAQHPVIVVDNASKSSDRDGLISLQRRYPQLTIIWSDKNIGYFPALNLGIKKARSVHPKMDAYVIGNNDLLFPSNLVSQISQIQSLLQKYPVVSPDIVTMDGEHQNPHVIAGISPFRERIYDLYHSSYFLAKVIIKVASWTKRFTDRDDESHHDVAQEINQGYGACYILSPKFFELFEELWAPSFLMYEEFFLSQQLAKRGYQVYYDPTVQVKHFCHASTGQLPSKLRWEYSRDAHKLYRQHAD